MGAKQSKRVLLRRILGFYLLLQPAWSAGGSLPDTIDQIRHSVVAIGTVMPTRQPRWKFMATGFVVVDGQHVITNAHVIAGGLNKNKNESWAILAPLSKNKGRRATIAKVDKVHDLALLKISGSQLPSILLGDSDQVREGESYAFTGFPIGAVLGTRAVTHRGIISAITPIAIPQLSSRSLDSNLIRKLRKPYKIFQLDATAYPGNSGSPVYSPSTGKVLGIVNKVFVKQSKENILKDPSGITYAIPIRYARTLLKEQGLVSD